MAKPNVPALEACGEKDVRFLAEDLKPKQTQTTATDFFRRTSATFSKGLTDKKS